MKFKIGDWISITNKKAYFEDINLYKKIGKIVEIRKEYNAYLIEFQEKIGYTDIYRKKGWKTNEGKHLWIKEYNIKSLINHYKFKKWLKG